LWTNSEAATEIGRQLRLRNIGGVIIIDFIDMDSRRDQLKLLEHFSRCIKADKARPQIAQLSELGLVELTRKRQGQNIYELFGKPCPTCGGLGHLVELPGEKTSISLETISFSPPSFSPSPKSVERRIIDLPEPVVDPVVNYESSETSSDFDLSYHPNYQEQGAKGSNRRRRRRPGPETNSKEETVTKVLPNLNKPVEVEELVEERPENLPEERPERRERIIRREDIPVERVSVEMTPLEQDVYALMGVSPLVRLDREFKDPKSVIVTVRSPGEPEVIPEIPEKTAPSLRKEIPMSSNDFSDLAETYGKEDEKEWMTAIAEEPNSNHFTNYVNPEQEMESTLLVVPESNAQEFEPIQEIEDKQEDPEQPVIRRRRRRSSAQED
jgi:ribonuclease E